MKFEYNNKPCRIDGYLASALDSLIYNIKEDWDFVILITGDRMVRVGKSVLAQQVAAYLAWRSNTYLKLPVTYNLNDIYFDSEDMIKAAENKPKFHINHYDEAREMLAASKHMNILQQKLIDFFNECGQLNHIFILVLPDFFELKEIMAVGRSEILLNVYRGEEKKMKDIYGEGKKIPVVKFKRGMYEFFSRSTKQKLYDKFMTSRRKNYFAVKADFLGNFGNYYMVDEEEYKEKKKDSLRRFQERQKRKVIDRPRKTDIIRDKIVLKLNKEGKSESEIAKQLKKDYDYEVDRTYIYKILDKYRDLD